jgi:glycosyltransferase involved in cell wall biosynthesis
MKSISIVIPAYNESECIEELASRLTKVMDFHNQYSWQVIIIENGSLDDSWEKLRDLSQTDNRFKVVKLSRNFRMDGGLTAGLEFVNTDACILMTADLQDPPEFIPKLLEKWEDGYENIYGIVTERIGTNRLRRFNSVLFYKVAGKLSDGRIPENASDFRLVDRKVYEVVREMTERNRFVRGLFAWVGFKSIGVPMIREPRFAGVSNAPTLKVIELALKGIFAHSYKPLRFISIFGMTLFGLSLVSLLILSLIWFIVGVPFAGFGSLTALILCGFGFQALLIGIVSEYLALIYEESKGRPNYIVSEVIGILPKSKN